MSKNVLVVESPAKAKTINRYLGKDFTVLASYGHIRQLKKKDGAVNPDNNFSMDYEISPSSRQHIKKIADALAGAKNLYLATDPDREGEAISWHLLEVLKARRVLKNKKVSRVVFNEITEKAIKNAIANARELAMDLVNAQQARSALDFLVGFNLSPLLWRKVQPGLSAGRVQSPALRLICQREEEIEAFVSQEYWTISADLTGKDAKQPFTAKLTDLSDKKLKQFDINNETSSANAVTALKNASNGEMTVGSVDKKERKRYPAPPFITSTLQQEASRKLGFGATRTMRLAQQLYEGVKVGSETVGLITYMRTDSVMLSNDAIAEFRAFVEREYGWEFIPNKPNVYKTKSKNAQEAHEAIRPTSTMYPPKMLKNRIDNDLWRLYDLIWKRAVASQMIHATLDTVAIVFDCGGAGLFKSTGSTIKHAGFLELYNLGQEQKSGSKEMMLPPLAKGDKVDVLDIAGTQHFTEPPPRYSEASLVKALEEYDIGRPSTYASIIQTLLNREYVLAEQRRLFPTTMGRIVNTFLTKHFSRYVDYDFTAHLEDDLDEVAAGNQDWLQLMNEFWNTFSQNVEDKRDIPREEVMQARELGTDPKTGKPVSVRHGRYGPFVQIGTKDDEEKPLFASLIGDIKFDEIDLDTALELFKLPLQLGEYEGKEIEVNEGRYGPYVKYDGKFISLGRDVNPLTVDYEQAVEVIVAKQKADAPIAQHDGLPVQKGVGRFGPFLKWNSIFINVNKKYDFDNLSPADIVELIEDKKRKEREKVIHNWEAEGIRVEKARWGRFNVIKGRTKVELAKDFDIQSLTVEEAQKLIDAKKPAKKTTRKTTAKKTTAKKATAKKTTKKAPAKKTTIKK